MVCFGLDLVCLGFFGSIVFGVWVVETVGSSGGKVRHFLCYMRSFFPFIFQFLCIKQNNGQTKDLVDPIIHVSDKAALIELDREFMYFFVQFSTFLFHAFSPPKNQKQAAPGRLSAKTQFLPFSDKETKDTQNIYLTAPGCY